METIGKSRDPVSSDDGDESVSAATMEATSRAALEQAVQIMQQGLIERDTEVRGRVPLPSPPLPLPLPPLSCICLMCLLPSCVRPETHHPPSAASGSFFPFPLVVSARTPLIPLLSSTPSVPP